MTLGEFTENMEQLSSSTPNIDKTRLTDSQWYFSGPVQPQRNGSSGSFHFSIDPSVDAIRISQKRTSPEGLTIHPPGTVETMTQETLQTQCIFLQQPAVAGEWSLSTLDDTIIHIQSPLEIASFEEVVPVPGRHGWGFLSSHFTKDDSLRQVSFYQLSIFDGPYSSASRAVSIHSVSLYSDHQLLQRIPVSPCSMERWHLFSVQGTLALPIDQDTGCYMPLSENEPLLEEAFIHLNKKHSHPLRYVVIEGYLKSGEPFRRMELLPENQ